MKILFNRGMAIIWILALVLPFWVYFSMLKFEIHQVKRKVKHEIIATLDKEDLELLAFTKEEAENNLRWEHSKEFEYRGEMYDIVDKKITEDSVYYWCWWDKEETVLVQKLYSLMRNRLSHDSQHQNKKSQLYQILDSIFLEKNQWNHTPEYVAITHHFYYQKEYFKFQDPPIIPPPDQNS